MSIFQLVILSLALCCITNVSILLFSETYRNTVSCKKINLLIIISTMIYILVIIIIGILNNTIISKEVRIDIAILSAVALSIVVFVINIYGPTLKIVSFDNSRQHDFYVKIFNLINDYDFESEDKRIQDIKEIENLAIKYKKEISNTSIEYLLQTLIKLSDSGINKAPAKLIELIKRTCVKMIDEFNKIGNPFSLISLLTSYALTSILTIIIAIFSLS